MISSQNIMYTLNEEQSFIGWMREHSKMYIGSEYQLRLGIFLANVRYINEFNKRKDRSFKLAVNELSCYTPAEYKVLQGHKEVDIPKGILSDTEEYIPSNTDVPDYLNYTQTGVDWAPVVNQQDCGSCWACSLVAVCQCKWKMASNEQLLFSVSNFVDCFSLFGCSGGDACAAYAYALTAQSGKLMLDSDYPYSPTVGTCKFDKNKAVTHWLVTTTALPYYNEDNLKEKIYSKGPASCAVDASPPSFQSYGGGVYDEPECSSVMRGHEVLIVGYGHDSDVNKDYWIVKNSWGKTWGEYGYIRFLRGKAMCAINKWVFWPKADYN